ncbi:MAG TPA: MerR family transcriptional regulator [Abditibacteriaceae bacterium]|nr:MerR family transcriptional regulator [Abditibacteriaceae bacterium]
MAENRIQDWIRYVQENSENLNDETLPPSAERPTQSPAPNKITVAPKPTTFGDKPGQIAPSEVVQSAALERAAQKPTTAATSTTRPSSTRTSVRRSSERSQRVRLRPETRAQMLARLTNPMISLHEASVILEVCSATVRRYSDLGMLPHVRTQGGQRRFRLREVLTLARTLETKKRKRE